jgi:hypothetical protein
MGRTFSHLFTHIVFSTKGRTRLMGPDLKAELHAYLGGSRENSKAKPCSILRKHIWEIQILRYGSFNYNDFFATVNPCI